MTIAQNYSFERKFLQVNCCNNPGVMHQHTYMQLAMLLYAAVAKLLLLKVFQVCIMYTCMTAPSETDRPAPLLQCRSRCRSMDHSVHAVPGAHQRSAFLAAGVSVAVMWCRYPHSLLAVGLLCTAAHASAGIKISSVDREVGVIPAVIAIVVCFLA